MAHVGERLFPDLTHLPKEKVDQIHKIRDAIMETGLANVILLYGSYARGDWKEQQGIRSGKRSDYDIMVLTKDERDRMDLDRKTQKMFINFPVAVQVVVETVAYVNMQLREKQFYYTEITKQGKMLYADKNFKFAEAENLPPERLKEIAERDFKHWFGTVRTDFEMYQYSYGKFNETKEDRYALKSAFELEQCVEHCYTTIEMVFSRTNIHDHLLFLLRLQAKRFVPEVDNCFPLHTEEEIRLFRHLDAAYIAARYPDVENYEVREQHFNYWEAETIKLMEITKNTCLEKIAGIG